MFIPKVWKIAIVAGLPCVMYPQISSAQGFDGSKLLLWDQKNQNSYIQVSVTMAGVIASQVDRTMARCIDDWHGRQEANGYRQIRESIGKSPTYHPQGVILLALRKACNFAVP